MSHISIYVLSLPIIILKAILEQVTWEWLPALTIVLLAIGSIAYDPISKSNREKNRRLEEEKRKEIKAKREKQRIEQKEAAAQEKKEKMSRKKAEKEEKKKNAGWTVNKAEEEESQSPPPAVPKAPAAKEAKGDSPAMDEILRRLAEIEEKVSSPLGEAKEGGVEPPESPVSVFSEQSIMERLHRMERVLEMQQLVDSPADSPQASPAIRPGASGTPAVLPGSPQLPFAIESDDEEDEAFDQGSSSYETGGRRRGHTT